MATDKQRAAARENIKKAQEKWREINSKFRSHMQPSGKRRAKPGEKGGGNYYRIEVRSARGFSTFRNHDVGESGGLQRLAGQRPSGSWDTVAWLVSKDFAHISNNKLIADHQDAKDLINKLGSKPSYKKGDIFTAKDRPNVPEKDKPTPAQKRARSANIKKAQGARHKK